MSAFHSEFGAQAAWPVEATRRMNRMYRRQRHIYDGTRRYYLLGRDQLIAGLRPAAGASVLEIGCGTGQKPGAGRTAISRCAFLRHRRIDGNADLGDLSHFARRPEQSNSRRARRR